MLIDGRQFIAQNLDQLYALVWINSIICCREIKEGEVCNKLFRNTVKSIFNDVSYRLIEKELT